MKKILVAGACGYIGARLSKYLAENGYAVTAFCRRAPRKDVEWASLMEEVIVGDVRDDASVKRLLQKDYDAAIYLISLDHRKSEENVFLAVAINVTPMWDLLHQLTERGLRKFIYFSTVQVYGAPPATLISENFPTAPSNAYGLTHLLCENICAYFHRKTDTDCITIRLSNSYGSPVFKDSNCWWLVINDLCKSAIQKGRIALLSDGSPQRDFIHGLDMARAVRIFLERENGELDDNVFQLASGNTLTILELAHVVKRVFEERYKKEMNIHFPDGTISMDEQAFFDVKRYCFDTKRLKKLRFQPETDMRDGIAELFEYLETR